MLHIYIYIYDISSLRVNKEKRAFDVESGAKIALGAAEITHSVLVESGVLWVLEEIPCNAE